MKEKYFKWENIPDNLQIIISGKNYGKRYYEIQRLKKFYIRSNNRILYVAKETKTDLPQRYYMNLGCIEILDLLLERGII